MEFLCFIKKITIRYNPLTLIKTQKPLLALNTAILHGVTITIRHYQDDSYNVLKVLQSSTSTANTDPLNLNIILKDSTITYIDSRGFGAKPATHDQQITLSKLTLSGKLSPGILRFQFSGQLNQNHNRIKGSGAVSSSNFIINGQGKSLEIADLVNYFDNQSSVKLIRAKGNVSASIFTLPKNAQTFLPFGLSVNASIQDAALKIDWIPPTVEAKSGLVTVTHEGVYFKNIAVYSAGQAFQFDGNIPHFHQLDLHVSQPHFEMSAAARFIPALDSLHLHGTAQFLVNIESTSSTPLTLSGSVKHYKGTFLQYEISEASLDFSKIHNTLNLNLVSLSSYDGSGGTGSGKLTFYDKAPPDIQFNFTLPNFNLGSYAHVKVIQTKGLLSVSLSGKPRTLEGTMALDQTSGLCYGQNLNSAHIRWARQNNALCFLDQSELFLNHSSTPLFLKGSFDDEKHFDLHLAGDHQLFSNLYFLYNNPDTLKVDTALSLNITGVLDDTFKVNPFEKTKAVGSLIIHSAKSGSLDYPLSGFGWVSINKTAEIGVQLTGPQSSLTLLVKTTHLHLISCLINANNIPLEGANTFIQDKENFVKGRFTGQIRLVPDSGNNLFLKQLSATGPFQIFGGLIKNQSILYCSGNMMLQNNQLTLKNSFFQQPGSLLHLDLTYQSTQNFMVTLNHSSFKSNDWSLFPNIIHIRADSLDGNLSRSNEYYRAQLRISLSELSYKSVDLPTIKGQIILDDNYIQLNNLLLGYRNDSYHVSGNIDKSILQNEPHAKYDLTASFDGANLEYLSELYSQLKPFWTKTKNIEEKQEDPRKGLLEKLNTLTQRNSVNLFSLSEKGLSDLLTTFQKSQLSQKNEELPKAEGKMSGYIRIANREGPLILGDLHIDSGKLFQSDISGLHFSTELENSNLRFHLLCDQIHFLDNDFYHVDLESIYNPSSHELTIHHFNTEYGGAHYYNVLQGKINLSPLLENSEESPNDFSLQLNLEKGNINLLSMFNSSLMHIYNDDAIELTITGPLWHPLLNSSKIHLKNFAITFRPGFPLQSPLSIADSTLSIVNNQIIIPETTIIWQGTDTNQKANIFVVSGHINLMLAFNNLYSIPLDLDLAVKPTHLEMNLPDLYIGQADTGLTTLKGIYQIPLTQKAKDQVRDNILIEKEEGPILQSTITFSDGRFLVINNRPPNVNKPSILLQTDISLGKGVYITGKNFDENINNFISNILIELEEVPEHIGIRGSLNTLALEHRFKLKDGKLIFMSQAFQLLDKTLAREIFKNNPQALNDNTVEIQMQPDPLVPTKRKAVPSFNLKAYAEVKQTVAVTENIGSSANVTYKLEDNFFVIFVNGFLTTPKSIAIEHYILDNGVYTLAEDRIELDHITAEQLDTISKYLLPALFKPQFYQSLLSKGLANNKDASDLVKNYSSSQIDLWIDQQLRPLAKEVASAVGLYDIKIEHQLGEDLVNAIPAFQATDSPAPPLDSSNSEKVKVEYIKDLFLKKLFVKLKTGLDQDPTSKTISVKLTQYELMWLLSDFISVNYGSYNLENTDGQYGAFSIDANFDF